MLPTGHPFTLTSEQENRVFLSATTDASLTSHFYGMRLFADGVNNPFVSTEGPKDFVHFAGVTLVCARRTGSGRSVMTNQIVFVARAR